MGSHGRVVIAVSGGPDSTALLLAWDEAARAGALPAAIGVAHLHHGMRGEAADDDQRHVARLAQRCELPLHAGRASLAGANEADARAARYAFLTEIACALGADCIATGHNADDQAETILMRIFRGSGIDGLAGIPDRRELPQGVSVVRPLLGSTRGDIEAFLSDRGEAGRHDSTNDDPRFTRGRIRRRMPELASEYNPRLSEALRRLARHAAHDREALEAIADRWFDEVVADAGVLDGARLGEAPVAVRHRVLLRWIRRWVPGSALEAASTLAWVERLEVVRAEGGVVVLPGDLRVERDSAGALAVATPRVPSLPAPDVPLLVPGRTELPDGSWIDARWREAGWRSAARGDAWLPERFGTHPLRVRGAVDGDRIAPLGLGGRHRLVRDLLREQGVPADRREHWPLVVDGETVVWIVGGAQSESVRCIGDGRQVLHLRLGN